MILYYTILIFLILIQLIKSDSELLATQLQNQFSEDVKNSCFAQCLAICIDKSLGVSVFFVV